MSGWVPSTPLSRIAMRIPVPVVTFHGPAAVALPNPPTCRTAHP